jgi:hypothetical protein
VINPERQFTPRRSQLSVGTVGLLTSATILRIYWRRQGCAKGRPIIGAKERVGIVKGQQIERLHGEPTFEPTSEMLVAIEEGTRSAQTERMYTADEIKERIRQWANSIGQVRHFKPSAKGKWDVLASSTMQVSVGDQIQVTAGFREGKNVFKNNDIVELQEVTYTELVLHDGRRMRRDGARIDQGVCITSHASQCRTVDQVVVLPDGADAKGWYVSLSRARDAMHVYTRNKAALRLSVMQPGERNSVWELLQALQKSKPQSRDQNMPDLWAARRAEIVRNTGMER